MASVRGKTYDHMVEHLPSVDKLGNQYMVTPLFPESKEITIVKIVGTLRPKLSQQHKNGKQTEVSNCRYQHKFLTGNKFHSQQDKLDRIVMFSFPLC